MKDEKILDEIKNSAEDIEVPDRLKPENIRELIVRSEDTPPESSTLQILPKNNGEKTPFSWRRFAAVAASVAVFFIAIPVGIVALRSVTSSLGQGSTKESASETEAVAEEAPAQVDAEIAEDTGSFETASVSVDEAFGGYFYTEESIDKVRETISRPVESESYGWGIRDFASGKSAADTGAMEEAAADGAVPNSGSPDSFSSTNLRELDVDEGDIVKTDGKYIYIYEEYGGVNIIDISGSKMKKVSEFDPDFSDADDAHLIDMFIRDDTLVLMAEIYSVDFSRDYGSADDTRYIITDKASEDVFMLGDSTHTAALTYDITDRSNPVKKGELSAEGSYQSSRISGNFLYLFTWYHGNDIPLLGGGYPKVDSIYLPKENNTRSTFTMTSMDLGNPVSSVDSKVIYSAANDVYVTSDCIILEVMEYDTRERTNLFRFSYTDGAFSPVGVGAVPGYIESSFSIDEDSDGRIRVATTTYGFSSQSSGVYVFDNNMKRIGKLTGLAKGENIQSARFLDNVLYLVTYENRDPLFTIDLSDPAKPTVIGKLKLPGFSDYLHFWDDTHLLGIGYDTKEEDGEVLGAKLSMFDISDPTDVKEVSTLTIKDVDNLPGMYNYKSLLVNPSRGLIGFGTVDWGNESNNYRNENMYMVYSYNNNTFTKLAAEKTTGNIGPEGTRGLFSGETFYIADETVIRAYDMNGGFKEIDKIRL